MLDRELVKRHIVVERLNDPVSVRPDLARVIVLIPVGVGVAGEVEPVPRPVLAVLRRLEQIFHLGPVGLVSWTREKAFDLLRRRRNPDQVKVESPHQHGGLGHAGRLEFRRIKSAQNEAVNRIAHPCRVRNGGQRRTLGFLVGPMALVLRTGGDPRFQ